MQAHDNMDRRLTELEIKASFQEDLLDQLNQVIVRQQRDIAQLVRDVDTLRQQGMQILATHLCAQAVDFRDIDYTRPTAILLGAEKHWSRSTPIPSGYYTEALRRDFRHFGASALVL